MATTPRLLLYKPVGTDLVNVTSHLNNQLDTIDLRACKTLVSPSGSPPTADFIGQEWFTSDTKLFYFWNGSSWVNVPFSPVSSAPEGPGKRALTVGAWTSDQFSTGPNAENGPLLPTTINVVNNKNYRIILVCIIKALDSTSSPECFINLRASVGSSVNTSGDLRAKVPVGIRSVVSSNLEKSYCCINALYPATATQQVTIGAFIQKNNLQSGNMGFMSTSTSPSGLSNGNYQFLYVEEM